VKYGNNRMMMVNGTRIIKCYPTIVTDKLQSSREFYTRHFGFNTVFENEWYLHLISDTGIRLTFLLPDHPTQPEHFHKALTGNGMFLNFEVENAEAEYNKLKKNGVRIITKIVSETWGQKHFVIKDPNGLKIDIFQEIQPTEEYEV